MPYDNQRAVEFFEQQLNYTTNCMAVKAVVEGRVKNVTIIDVRAAKHFAQGHIPGAINIPYDQYNEFQGNEKHFEQLTQEGCHYVYCYDNYCSLALKACKLFAQAGYKVKEVKGGYEDWKTRKLPIEHQ